MSLIATNRNYRLLFSAAAVSNLGDGIAMLAFPWLATLVTRDAALIALVAAASRLPWLLFSLPAGVITDQYDRRRLMVLADVLRTLITAGVIGLVLSAPALPLADDSAQAPIFIFGLCAAALLLGSAEVLRDNAAQTAMPSIVEKSELEKANGQLWSIEQIMGQFVGPPVAGILIALAVPIPFVVNALMFGGAAWCMWLVVLAPRDKPDVINGFWSQMREGIDWIRSHALILRLAIMLGGVNFVFFMSATILVLLSQEIYGLSAAGHGILLTAGAVGGVAGGMIGPLVSKRLGGHRTVMMTLFAFPLPLLILAVTSNPYVASIALFMEVFFGMIWNVVTVSLRQRIIPDELLGRVNSIYRFFGWGTIPLGALFAGFLVNGLEGEFGRELALRAPYIFGVAASIFMAIYGALKLRIPPS
ncbi:MFS transporter [uncultured Litoreibacter sp.]|uniref:MFS transporter n=1 Tax=uncultured Litoreibacter sp. TaxID=1392394 RepID=UPI00260FB8BD|nr:MFS transporter [uncultured Litoreibacter sp.]